MAAPSPRSSLPQGFSVYQPALGAQLQFFPALGSQQLDDLINAHVQGPASIKDKRATISLDFLHHARTTGPSFKFYPAAPSVSHSPMTARSPSLDSASSSSFNVSPVTSSWDWSATASVSSRSSTHRRRPAMTATASPRARPQPTDFSSLPGMKILTKDGLDVTNSASRGSKTKEQRDHAHLMRIIKACDSCRRKKIRCDPSHKKRAAPPAAPAGAKQSRKAKSPRPSQAPPPPSQGVSQSLETMQMDGLDALLTPSLDLFDFTLSGLESLDPVDAALNDSSWDDFMQFPPLETVPDYDLCQDPDGYFASQSSGSSSSASPLKVLTPQSLEEMAPLAPDGTVSLEPAAPQPQYPFLDQPGLAGDYTDFDLFSPGSSFSEDDRMLSIGSSSHELTPSRHHLASLDDREVAAAAAQLQTTGDSVGGVGGHPGSGFTDSTDRDVLLLRDSTLSSDSPRGLADLRRAPDLIQLAAESYNDSQLHVSPSFDASDSASSAAVAPAITAELPRRSVTTRSTDSQAGIATFIPDSELPATASGQDGVATTASSASWHDPCSAVLDRGAGTTGDGAVASDLEEAAPCRAQVLHARQESAQVGFNSLSDAEAVRPRLATAASTRNTPSAIDVDYAGVNDTTYEQRLLSVGGAFASTAGSFAPALALLTASVMPALQCAYVAVAASALVFELAWVLEISSGMSRTTPTIKEKLSQTLVSAKARGGTRGGPRLAGTCGYMSVGGSGETSWRAASAGTLLRV